MGVLLGHFRETLEATFGVLGDHFWVTLGPFGTLFWHSEDTLGVLWYSSDNLGKLSTLVSYDSCLIEV